MQTSPSCHWLDNFLVTLDNEGKIDDSISAGKQFVDTFRYFYPIRKEAFTCWSTVTSARKTNYGTRIDYIFADKDLVISYFNESQIQPEIEGSDHCPIYADLKCTINPSCKLPSLCSKNMSEFSKKQSKLTGFLKSGKEKMERSEAMENEETAGGAINTSIKIDNNGCNLKRDSNHPSNVNIKRSKVSTKQSANLLRYFSAKQKTPCNLNTSTSESDKGKNSMTTDKSDTSTLHNLQCNNKENSEKSETATKTRSETSKAWKSILRGPPPIPLCSGHKLPSVMRVVKKSGPNQGRQFFVCTLPEGHRGNPNARCNFFQWAN